MTAKARDLIISYTEDLQLFRTGVRKFWFGVLLLALVIAPWAGASTSPICSTSPASLSSSP